MEQILNFVMKFKNVKYCMDFKYKIEIYLNVSIFEVFSTKKLFFVHKAPFTGHAQLHVKFPYIKQKLENLMTTSGTPLSPNN